MVSLQGMGTSISSVAALACLLCRYTGEQEFSLVRWKSEAPHGDALSLQLEDRTTLNDLASIEEGQFAESGSANIVLVEGTNLPRALCEFEVVFCVSQADDHTEIVVHYREDLYHADTATQWARHLLRILEASPESPILQIQLLSDSEQADVLAHAGSPVPSLYEKRSPEAFTFPRLFAQQVAASPDATALLSGGDRWSYAELDGFANQLAHHLIATGVRPGDRVGVHLDRQLEFLGALLGIFKAGAGYVPLEPDLPEARRAFMQKDAGVEVIVDACMLKKLAREEYASTPPEVPLSASGLAYVIYTSGSTGEPKGVEISLGALCDFCLVMNATYALGPEHTWLAITTIAFDACIMELFPLLLCGGCVALAPPKSGSDGEALSELIAKTAATHLWATPTTLRILVGTGWKGSADLTIFSGGEAVDRDIAETVLPLCARLINGYGPTETTVFATNHTITHGSGPVPLGRPMSHMTVHLLDDAGNPVPPLARGHLWIGGQGAALGYLGRPELTAEKFRPDSFSEDPEARLYDSGDVAYRDRDGLLYYLGRSDHQIKLRGYRIELGEIEARLATHPSVLDAAVLVREDAPGEQRLVAYLVTRGGVPPADEVLQTYLGETMPEYMVPAWFVSMESFPVTAGLKLDRRALPAPESLLVEVSDNLTSQSTLPEQIAALWARVLGRPRLSPDAEVFHLGANSLNAVRIKQLLESELGLKVPVSQIFQHATPAALATYLEDDQPRPYITAKRDTPIMDIAVVGMACRFPGAPDLDAYWDLLANGREAIQTFTQEELEEADVSGAEAAHPDYVPRGTVLEGALDFDPAFFGVSRPDAAILSPQIRLFLTTAWEALEYAGYPGETPGHPIGIFAGAGDPSYLYPTRDLPEHERLQTLIGNSADFLTTRTAFALGLTGPAVAVQTACSTSLVAIAEACHALRAGRCAMALAGGVSFSWPHAQGYLAGEGLIYSRAGHCRPFDSRADGTIFSQGAGVVLLKPLDEALADGDTVHAVIKGIATNNDGARKAGYAAPSIAGQSEVIRAALADARVSAREVGYVEAHGTATKIGDPIEVAGLTAAFRDHTQDLDFCALGSVKGNIGHVDAAAGVAGFLKVVLALKHKALPPTLHYETPNPEIAFEDTPFRVQTALEHWETTTVRRAGLSAFGMGGTNAHAILEEAPTQEAMPEPNPWELLPLSARTPIALAGTVEKYASITWPDINAAAFTLKHGRKLFSHRAFALSESQASVGKFHVAPSPAQPRRAVFLFTGQGAQYLRMGEALYQTEPVFKEALDECDRLLSGGLLAWLFPKDETNAVDINQTCRTQPAMFAVMWAQAALWRSWGVEPAAMIGHSIGEYVAATLAGVYALQDALEIVALRAQLMQSMEPGGMLAVPASAEAITSLLAIHPDLDLAVENAPELSVVAGPHEAIDKAVGTLKEKNVQARILHTSHAFHSRMMEPLLEEFTAAVAGRSLSAPQIPYGSNVTGTWISAEEAISPDYYARQIRSTVRFSQNVRTLLEEASDNDPYLFLEMGPGKILTALVSRQLGGTDHRALPTLPGTKDPQAASFTREALGHAWAAGLQVPFPKSTPQRVPLPTTAFDSEVFHKAKPTATQTLPDAHGPLYHIPSWKEEPLPPFAATKPVSAPWLVFSRGRRNDRADFAGLTDLTSGAVIVRPGKHFRRHSAYLYTIRAGEPSDYETLIEKLTEDHGATAGILHAWTLGQTTKAFWTNLDLAAASLTWIARAFASQPLSAAIPFNVLTKGIHSRKQVPVNHTLPAAAAVIQKEIPGLATKILELDDHRPNHLAQFLADSSHYPFLAHSQEAWWARTYTPLPLPSEPEPSLFQPKQSILITGGLGGLALAIAKGLASRYQDLTFLLLARATLPAEATWDDPDLGATSTERIAAVRDLRNLGSEVHLIQTDLAEASSLTESLQQARAKSPSGKIDVVLHTAGVLEDGVIATKSAETFQRVFAAKALGADLLVEALADAPPRFVFFSSIATDLGLFGQIDYSCANAYLDGLASKLHREGIPAYSINWPAFHTVGMAARTASAGLTASGSDVSLAAELATNALSPEEGTGALLGVLSAANYPRVAISKRPFRDRQEAAIADGRETIPTQHTAVATTKESPLETMLELWRAQLQQDDLQAEHDYFEAGGDSLTAVALTSKIEQTFGLPMPISYLLSSPTVAGLTEKLGLQGTSNDTVTTPPFLHLLEQGSPNKPPIVLIHGADGGILFYRAFAQALDTGNPIYAIEAPMLHDLEINAPDSMEAVAAGYLDMMRENLPKGPVILAGYSLGGIIAYDIAQRLHAAGETPLSLILFDTPNPAAPVHFHSALGRVRTYWKNLGNGSSIEKLAQLGGRIVTGATTRLAHEIERFRARGKSASDTDIGDHWRHIQCREQHMPLEDAYIPSPYPGDLRVLITRDVGDKFTYAAQLGWTELAPRLATAEISGPHLDLFEPPHIDGLISATRPFVTSASSLSHLKRNNGNTQLREAATMAS